MLLYYGSWRVLIVGVLKVLVDDRFGCGRFGILLSYQDDVVSIQSWFQKRDEGPKSFC